MTVNRTLQRSLAVAGAGALLLLGVPLAEAASFGTPAVAYTAGGIADANGTYFAKSGSTLTLTVNTDDKARCVAVAGLPSFQTSTTAKTTWTFPGIPTAPATTADGVQSRLVTIGEANNNNGCTTKPSTSTASYVLDNTGPSVSASLNPQPNTAGWNSGTVVVSWIAGDRGGVGGGTVTGNTTVSTDTAGQTVTGIAADALGNVGLASSVVVRRDTVKPAISGQRAPAANGFGWNNTDVTVSFTCSDALSQIASCVAEGTSGASRTLGADGAGQSVSGTATDNAGNIQTGSVGQINIDKVAPSVTATATVPGGPSGTAYVPGTWTNRNVTVAFGCTDGLSGVDTCNGAKIVNSEGAGQSVTGSGKDKAGNTATRTFGAIDIDKTAPVTSATAPAAWNNTDVTVSLAAHDALSGVSSTRYSVDGGPVQDGTGVPFSSEGVHTLSYWSVDKAGNTEVAKTISVKIDKTPPTITHTQSPAANGTGWNSSDVTVTFVCGDGGSGVAGCGPDTTVTTEGGDQTVTGTATDNAGNTATDPATVNIDKTAPTAVASVTSAATRTETGWYNKDVTVSYACADNAGGSGVDTCSAPVTLGEGGNQSVTGTAVDAAGNTGSVTVDGINVDKTPPALHGTPTTAVWSTGDVVVSWTCTDAGSGVVEIPAPVTVTGEGSDLSASATCADKAGNTVTTTVPGIMIDRSAPNTTATIADPFDSAWYADSVDVTLSGLDGLSGVARTYYRVDGADPVSYGGTFAFDVAGKHTLTYWSVDEAGNVEDATGNSVSLWIDNALPTITGAAAPAANGFGWHNAPVTVSFACADGQSGVAGCADPVQFDKEGADQQVTGSATDGVGKSAGTMVGGINIDWTAPTLSGAPTTDARAGWFTGDVAIRWTGQDGLSGIDPASLPADTVISGEGRGLGAGPVTVKDKAGNESGPATVSGVAIDRKGPAITGGPTTQPNAAGWYSGEVVVDFACTDPALADGSAGSGVATCPTGTVLRADGAGQSVTGDTAADVAGNVTQGRTVGGINIDGTAPTTTSDNQCTRTNGYCTGSTANVVLTATDQAGLSGVKEIRYRIGDNGATQTVAGASTTVAVPLDGSGEGTVTYWAVDNAGNTEAANTASLKWDNIAPTVTHSVSPAPNADEWNNSDVTVRFSATDDDKGSGVDASSITPDVVVSAETAAQLVSGQAKDVAGNTGTDTAVVKVDRTKPVIAGSIISGTSGSRGWYVSPVTVHFTCSDALSGIPATTCPDDVTLTGNGAGQSVTRTVVDRAGNVGSVTVGGIGIDQELPAITAVTVADGAVYNEIQPAPSCTAEDSVSGVDTCSVAVTQLAGAGEYSFTATAKDKAGNTSVRSGRYRVNLYVFGGFGQPINDGGTLPVSVFKAGSTVPVKFQLRNNAGALVQARSTPVFLTPVKGGLTTAPLNETPTADMATADGLFRWDASAQQYIVNWQTKGLTPGYHYKIGVRLDDGQTFLVTVGLK